MAGSSVKKIDDDTAGLQIGFFFMALHAVQFALQPLFTKVISLRSNIRYNAVVCGSDIHQWGMRKVHSCASLRINEGGWSRLRIVVCLLAMTRNFFRLLFHSHFCS
jgi:hypothetical protein